MDEKSCGSGNGCKCPCHRALGILAALMGLTFLLGNLGVVGARLVGIAWPSLLILAGLKIATGGMCKCCAKS